MKNTGLFLLGVSLFFMLSCGNQSSAPAVSLPERTTPVDTLYLEEPETIHLLDTIHALITFPLRSAGDTLMHYVVTSVNLRGENVLDTVTVSLGKILDTVDTQRITVSWRSTDTTLLYQVFLDDSVLSGWIDSTGFQLPVIPYPGVHSVSVIIKNPALGEIVGIIASRFLVRATGGLLAKGLRYVKYNSSFVLSFDGQPPFKQWNAAFSIDTAHLKIESIAPLNFADGWNFFLPDSIKMRQPKFTISVVIAPDKAIRDTLRDVGLMSLSFDGSAEGLSVDSAWILP